MEFWDLYDIDRLPTGKTMRRGEKHTPGFYHTVVHVCLFNSNGDMLIQQRQPFKSGWSNMWDITLGGSTVAGETSRQGVARELSEEIGLSLDFADVRPAFTINFAHGFDDFYIIEAEPDITSLRLQPEEVQRVKWANKAEIILLIESGDFIPYRASLINLIFDMHAFGDIHSRADTSRPSGGPTYIY